MGIIKQGDKRKKGKIITLRLNVMIVEAIKELYMLDLKPPKGESKKYTIEFLAKLFDLPINKVEKIVAKEAKIVS
jgi:hypothetical protein